MGDIRGVVTGRSDDRPWYSVDGAFVVGDEENGVSLGPDGIVFGSNVASTGLFPYEMTAEQWAALTAHCVRMMFAVRQREFMAERQRYIETPPGERDTATYFDPMAARDAAADAVAGVVDVLSKTVGYVDP